MIELKAITKQYVSGDNVVDALKGISVCFRDNEFVSILGPSGCGKTTLLNIVGGLDRYTAGDLIIDGISTKDYTDAHWDDFRNHQIGFVFQTYNLIPHQNVLSNVELALTLSGVDRAERKARAIEALTSVGLAEQIYKMPNQLSGGQMQRVAIARALVNNPKILLADEPTGALDTETSVQVLEILKEVSRDRLVIMVTHNPELAAQYSTRIVSLKDGLLVNDSAPFSAPAIENVETCDASADKKSNKKIAKPRRRAMSLWTALSLSLKNLLSKKARTILTSFAGSIGIIGIALILSMSNGFQVYIDRVQEETLSTYPLTVYREETNMTDMLTLSLGAPESKGDIAPVEAGTLRSNGTFLEMINKMQAAVKKNNLKRFKSYLETTDLKLSEYTTGVKYTYDLDLQIYRGDTTDVTRVNPSTLLEKMLKNEDSASMGGAFSSAISTSAYSSMLNFDVFVEMLDNQQLFESQYDLLDGHWPTGADKYKQAVLFVGEDCTINDLTLYSLGIKDQSAIEGYYWKYLSGNAQIDTSETTYTYQNIYDLDLKLVLNSDLYEKSGVTYGDNKPKWESIVPDDDATSPDYTKLKAKIADGLDINIVGIAKAKEGTAATTVAAGAVGYTKELTEYVIDEINSSEIARQQQADTQVDVFSGKRFGESSGASADLVEAEIAQIMNNLRTLLAMYDNNPDMFTAQSLNSMMSAWQGSLGSLSTPTVATYEGNLKDIGVVDITDPESISFYPSSFAAKDAIEKIINDYNAMIRAEAQQNKLNGASSGSLSGVGLSGAASGAASGMVSGATSGTTSGSAGIVSEKLSDEISYTDYIGLILSSVTDIVDAVSYVLIAFVSISLVVSSIMIGVITYISVLERTKEIGVLRSLGASKRDISRVFNAETLIVGFTAGLMGILITLLMVLPINIILYSVAGISSLARLPILGAVILVVISMLLTVVAGLIPSGIAAKKDPVVALRTE